MINNWIICAVFSLLQSSAEVDLLNDVRADYKSLAAKKELCEEYIERLNNNKDLSATHMGYLGGLKTIWANHVFNPVTKLKTFNQGKAHIEKAINWEPDNAELRFVRLSVQSNAPRFLGYHENIVDDTEFLILHRNKIKSTVVQEYINSLLQDHN